MSNEFSILRCKKRTIEESLSKESKRGRQLYFCSFRFSRILEYLSLGV